LCVTAFCGKSSGEPDPPAVDDESYDIELKDDEGYGGDRASQGAFRRFIEE
jgi:hypothetical protein